MIEAERLRRQRLGIARRKTVTLTRLKALEPLVRSLTRDLLQAKPLHWGCRPKRRASTLARLHALSEAERDYLAMEAFSRFQKAKKRA